MADRLRWFGRRLGDLGTGFVDAFVRDNRVLPPVLAVLALFVIAWILAGAFMGETDQKPVAHRADLAQADLAQSDGGGSGGDPVSPGVENRDVSSYAAYRSKDPFRELLAPEDTAPERTTRRPADRNRRDDAPGAGRTPDNPGATNRDADADSVPDRRERTIGSDPNNPDTDGDGIPDGSDDDTSDDGRLDTGGPGAGSGPGTGATPGTGTPGRGDRNGDLLNSGGMLPLP